MVVTMAVVLRLLTIVCKLSTTAGPLAPSICCSGILSHALKFERLAGKSFTCVGSFQTNEVFRPRSVESMKCRWKGAVPFCWCKMGWSLAAAGEALVYLQ
jgi:hypothetical protein